MTEPPLSPPSSEPAWHLQAPRAAVDSRSPASGRRRRGPRRQRHRARDRCPDDQRGHRRRAASHRRAGLHALGRGERGDGVGEAAETRRQLRGRPGRRWARAAAYCDCDTRKAASAWARTRRSVMACADRRARSKARWAVASACAAPLRITGTPTAGARSGGLLVGCPGPAQRAPGRRRLDPQQHLAPADLLPSRTRTCATRRPRPHSRWRSPERRRSPVPPRLR